MTPHRTGKKHMTVSAFIAQREQEQEKRQRRMRTLEELDRITCNCPACQRRRQRLR